MKLLTLLILCATLLFSANESFSKSKKTLFKIHANHPYTFYCGCEYDHKNKENMINRSSCGYLPRNELTKKGKLNMSTRRMGWEHIVPAENFGREFSCWRDGDAKCIKSNGKSFKGRKCCQKVNKKFRIMQADMHNLQPAIAELNAHRANFKFDTVVAKSGQYGECRFEVDFKAKRARVKEELRGTIARTYLYFNKQYGMKLSKQELQKYQAWNKSYPPTQWEIQRNKEIAKAQGNANQFIK